MLNHSIRNSDKNLNRTATIGPIGTNGNPKLISVSFTFGAFKNVSGSCPSSFTQPSATLRLQKSSNGTTWSTVPLQTVSLSGSASGEYEAEGGGRCISSEQMSESFTYTDSSTSTADFYYRAVISNQIRHHSLANVSTQVLGITSTEA